MAAISHTADTDSGGLTFHGLRSDLFSIVLQNVLLGMVTLGIYRFWGKTKLRRYFWNNLHVSGEPLEYVGRGMELFLGFLVAVVVLVPMFVGYAVLRDALAGTSPALIAVMELSLYLVLFFLVQLAIYRARRYRMTRSVWRGIRFGLDGNSFRYALMSFGHGILVVLTLGAYYPWRQIVLARYMGRHSRFGTQHFGCDGKGRELLRPWLPVLFTTIGAIGVSYGWLIYRVVTAMGEKPLAPDAVFARLGAMRWTAMDTVMVCAFVAFLAFNAVFAVTYWVREFNYIGNRLSLGGVKFTVALRVRRVMWRYGVYWAAVVLPAIGLYYAIEPVIYPMMAGAAAGAGLPEAMVTIFASVYSVVFAFAIMSLAVPFIKMVWLDYEILREACRSIGVQNIAALDGIVQSSKDAPRMGEGLADALDVTGGI